jgi:hypothetical protein
MEARPPCSWPARRSSFEGHGDRGAAELGLEGGLARRGGADEAAVDDDGLAAEEVGEGARDHVGDREAAPVDLDVGEDGPVDVAVEAIDDGVGGLAGADVGDGAAADAAHAVEEVVVDGAADAEAKQAGVAAALLDLGEDLGLVADVAVGQEQDHAQALGVGGAIEGGLDAGEHLGAAAAAHAGEEGEAAATVVLGVLERGVGELAGVAGEAEDLEGVGGAHAVEGLLDGGDGGVHRLAHHRAGGVEREHQLARAGLVLRVGLRGLDGEGEVAAVFTCLLGHELGARLEAGELPGEVEVAVGAGAAAGELEAGGAGGGVDGEGVILGAQGGEREGGLDGDLDVDLGAGDDALGEAGPGDGGGVRDLGGAGDVARADGDREEEAVAALLAAQRLDHVHLDLDGAAGRDVGDGLGEQVRPVLLEEGGALAGVAGVLVGLAGVGAGLHDAAELATVDADPVVVDGGVGGEREVVEGLEAIGERVVEHLDDGGLGHVADDDGVVPGLAQREAEPGVALLDGHAALGDVAGGIDRLGVGGGRDVGAARAVVDGELGGDGVADDRLAGLAFGAIADGEGRVVVREGLHGVLVARSLAEVAGGRTGEETQERGGDGQVA